MKHVKAISRLTLMLSILIGLVGCSTAINTAAQPTAKATVEPTSASEVSDIPPTLPAAEMEDVLAELVHLKQVNLDFLSRPGWLHLTQKTWGAKLENPPEEDENAPYSTAGMFPPIQVYDSWSRVTDDEGTLGYGHFAVNSDENGNPVQVVASDSEGNGGNLTLLERGLTEFFENDPIAEDNIENPVKITSRMSDIIEGFERVRNLDTEVQANHVFYNGAEEYQIVIQTAVVDEPYEFDWLSEPVGAFITFYRIDPLTGVVLEMTSYNVGLSGGIYKDFSQLTLVMEIVDKMPEDVRERYEAALSEYFALLEEEGK